jgi:hypothetical protein
LEAGRRLLKLYAAEPERCKPEVVAVALQQALVRLPDADFIGALPRGARSSHCASLTRWPPAACCLVPLRVQEEEPVKVRARGASAAWLRALSR